MYHWHRTGAARAALRRSTYQIFPRALNHRAAGAAGSLACFPRTHGQAHLLKRVLARKFLICMALGSVRPRTRPAAAPAIVDAAEKPERIRASELFHEEAEPRAPTDLRVENTFEHCSGAKWSTHWRPTSANKSDGENEQEERRMVPAPMPHLRRENMPVERPGRIRPIRKDASCLPGARASARHAEAKATSKWPKGNRTWTYFAHAGACSIY